MALDLLETAKELVRALDAIRAGGFTDESLIQRAKALNFQLGPVFDRLYGGTPLIVTEYPSQVWWPRAKERASQALASLEGGVVVETPKAVQRRPGQGAANIARLRALENQLLDLLADPRSHYFDPPIVHELYQRYAQAVSGLQREAHELFEDAPLRELPASSGTTDNGGRGYIDESSLTSFGETSSTASNSVSMRRTTQQFQRFTSVVRVSS